MRKKLLSFILCLAMVFSVNSSVFAATVQNPNEETGQVEEQEEVDVVGQLPTGLEPLEVVEISPEEYAAIAQSQEEQENVYAANNYDWSKYSGTYCYNHMTDTQKRLYKGLEAACREAATTTDTVNPISGYYALDFVSYSGMSLQDAINMTNLFVYQNPQYYFVSNQVCYSGANKEISVCIYSDFADGNHRKDVSNQFMNKINTWETQLVGMGNEYDCAKKAQDIVCDNVEYIAGTYDQSAYGAVIEGKTVCAGYTKMYEILCNAAGIESIGVTSTSHAWNKVKVGNEWYNVDTTWADTGGDKEAYFLISDATLQQKDVAGAHVEEYAQYGLYPECLTNYTDPKIPLTGVSLSESNVTLKRGEQKTLSVGYQPANATERPGVVWTSSNPGAVSVDNKGVITALTQGSSAVITAQVGAFSASCRVQVQKEEKPASNGDNGNKPSGGTAEKPQGMKVASYQGNDFYQDGNGKMRCYDANGNLIKNNFKCDGTYTYYFQNDGTAMTDRLTYHPDGKHVIYFDEKGHEVFNNFTHVKKSITGDAVDDLCFFDVYGHMYVDFITYDQAGVNLYYANPYGVMEHNGWFRFSDGNIGYANADGTLMTNQFSYDQWGRKVYFQGDGKLARGLISDGTTYYQMDEADGHCTGEFKSY